MEVTIIEDLDSYTEKIVQRHLVHVRSLLWLLMHDNYPYREGCCTIIFCVNSCMTSLLYGRDANKTKNKKNGMYICKEGKEK